MYVCMYVCVKSQTSLNPGDFQFNVKVFTHKGVRVKSEAGTQPRIRIDGWTRLVHHITS